MIVDFIDAVAGTPVYINPAFVVSMRPDPERPTEWTEVHMQDGQTLRVIGEHSDVADKLAVPAT
jgi:hypothetical protein